MIIIIIYIHIDLGKFLKLIKIAKKSVRVKIQQDKVKNN